MSLLKFNHKNTIIEVYYSPEYNTATISFPTKILNWQNIPSLHTMRKTLPGLYAVQSDIDNKELMLDIYLDKNIKDVKFFQDLINKIIIKFCNN